MSRTKLAILRIFMWFHLFGVASLISATTNNDALHRRPTGRVTLFSFERGNLRTVTDNVDTEVVLTMPPRYFEAYLFECNASYPVQWAYIGEAAPVVTADVGRFFQDFYDVNSYTYQSILIMYTLQELQSGRYICRGASKEYDKLAIHYDVFVPGNGSQILLSTSEKKLFVTESKEHAYIPCGVSDSTAVVNLYRGNQWGTFYPVPSNGSISFNPRKGFKIRFKDFLDPWGTYLCVAASNKKRRKVHLIPESVKAKYDLINHVNGKIPVYFSYEYEFNRILCCTGTNFIPKLQWAGCGSILDCQVKSACFEEDRCERRLGNSGYNPAKWIDPGPLPPGCSGYRLRDDPNGDFGLFKCSTPGIAQYQPYLLNRRNIFLDFEKTPPSEMILTLQRISPEGPSFVGDELEFHCNSTRFYFAYGIRWGWEKLNGEIDFIEDSAVVRDKYFVTGHRRRTTFKISHSNIKSIICFVPVVNSATEWRTVSLPVVIATNEANLISTQNNPPTPNNVIDLDSITYRYDTSNPPVPPVQQAIPPPQHQQKTQRADLQVYKSAKSPHEEFQPIQTSSIEHQDKSQYYNYAHGSSSEYPTATHTNAHQPHHSNSNPIIGAQQLIQQQPQIVDIYSPGIQQQASTPSPTTISISRSKKTRSRTSVVSSTSRSAPISKPDIHYDPTDRDYSTMYDSFEPNPSSSITSNARLHSTTRHYQHHVNQRMRAQPSPSRMSSAASSRKHATVASTTRRPPLSASTSNNNYNNRDEKYTSSNSNKEKDYADYHERDNDQFGVDMRLSLPFDPALPSSSKGRHAHPHNYTSSRDIPSRKSNARTHATDSSRSNSNSRRPSYTRSQSSSPLSSTSSRHIYQNHPEKDYTIENSYSQHVRLSLPSNAVGTQVPKSHQGGGRSRGRHHEASHSGHGRARGRSHSSAGSSRQHRIQDYYIEDSPVEVKVSRPKAHHDAYISSSQIRQNSGSGSRDRHHHQQQQHHSHSSTSQQPKELHTASGTNDEPQHHESSPTTYLRRRPYAEDVHSRPTSQSYIYGDQVKPSSSSSASSDSSATSNRHEPQPHSPLPAPTIQYHKQVYQSDIHDEHYKSARRHRDRTRSRAMKFNAEASGDGIVVDAYELASPSSRPAYFFSPHQHQEPNSNEIVRADMELKRLQPYRHTSSSRPAAVKGKSNNNSSDILHSVSISISSRVSHAYDDEDAPLADHHHNNGAPDEISEKADNEAHESGDYDVYSPQHTNYKSSTTPSTFKLVPIQFFHVKPSEKSSFQPAKSVVDDDDDDEIG